MSSMPQVQPKSAPATLGFHDADGFAMLQRAANLMAASSLVPKHFQGNLPNCVIAMNMAIRMGADPLMVAQNLYVVHGSPGWSAQFLIAAFNSTPGFSKLRYEFKGEEGSDDWACRAWAIETETGERLEGAWVSIMLAKKEGWHDKPGSKWKTMPQQMLMYRAASWFVRTIAPEIGMGLQTREEIVDTYDMEQDERGTYQQATAADDLNAKISAAPIEAQPSGATYSMPTQEQEAGKEPKQAQASEEQAKRHRPTKEEMDAKRAAASRAVLEIGLSLEDVEARLNAYAKDWDSAKCERALKLAAEHVATRQAAPAEPVNRTCPNTGNIVRPGVECAACDQNGVCPETDE